MTDERRFYEGMPNEQIDGIWFRVVKGVKGPNDLRLDWNVGGSWRPVSFTSVFYMCDMFYENEAILYPERHHRGGEKLTDAIDTAIAYGWRVARDRVHQERCNKSERGNVPTIAKWPEQPPLWWFDNVDD